MPEESWNTARLIPTSGINGEDERERRATSALLAVIPAVKEFGRALLGSRGAPAGHLETYIEVPFQLGDQTLYPDGLIRTKRGQRSWTALVEVKTGTNALVAQQLENYLDVAREHGFDAVITISNEIPPASGQHPTPVDRRKMKKVALLHLPWAEVLSAAIMQKEHRGVADPDQAWILGELIRYLEHPRSGALAFDDMGSHWVSVREAVRSGTLRATDKGVADVVARFDALLRYIGLTLGRKLGVDVQPLLSRKELADPGLRGQSLIASLTAEGSLSGAIRIPEAAATLNIRADLRTGQVACHCDVDAPRQGRNKTKVTWLTRQLKEAPDGLRVECFAFHARAGTAELLRAVRSNPDLLIADPDKELRAFRVTQVSALGAKRGTGRGSFIDSVTDAVDSFYSGVLQNLRSWAPTAPRLREEPEAPDVPAALVSTALSSQDDPDLTGQVVPSAAAANESADASTGADGSVVGDEGQVSAVLEEPIP